MPTVNMEVFEESRRHQVVQKYEVYPLNATDIEDYQIELTGMASNIKEDARIIQDDLIDQWVESKGNVWSKLASLKAKTPQIILGLSGNPSAISASNGDVTFPLFDDFPGSSIDTSKWNKTGTVTVSAGNAQMVGTNAWDATGIGSDITFNRTNIGYNLNFRWKFIVGAANVGDFLLGYSNKVLDYSDGFVMETGTLQVLCLENGVRVHHFANFVSDTWYTTELTAKVLNDYSLTVNDVTHDDAATNNDRSMIMQTFRAGTTLYIDRAYVRKYTTNKPIVTDISELNRASLIKALGSRL